jgi:hypothetical protein
MVLAALGATARLPVPAARRALLLRDSCPAALALAVRRCSREELMGPTLGALATPGLEGSGRGGRWDGVVEAALGRCLKRLQPAAGAKVEGDWGSSSPGSREERAQVAADAGRWLAMAATLQASLPFSLLDSLAGHGLPVPLPQLEQAVLRALSKGPKSPATLALVAGRCSQEQLMGPVLDALATPGLEGSGLDGRWDGVVEAALGRCLERLQPAAEGEAGSDLWGSSLGSGEERAQVAADAGRWLAMAATLQASLPLSQLDGLAGHGLPVPLPQLEQAALRALGSKCPPSPGIVAVLVSMLEREGEAALASIQQAVRGAGDSAAAALPLAVAVCERLRRSDWPRAILASGSGSRDWGGRGGMAFSDLVQRGAREGDPQLARAAFEVLAAVASEPPPEACVAFVRSAGVGGGGGAGASAAVLSAIMGAHSPSGALCALLQAACAERDMGLAAALVGHAGAAGKAKGRLSPAACSAAAEAFLPPGPASGGDGEDEGDGKGLGAGQGAGMADAAFSLFLQQGGSARELSAQAKARLLPGCLADPGQWGTALDLDPSERTAAVLLGSGALPPALVSRLVRLAAEQGWGGLGGPALLALGRLGKQEAEAVAASVGEGKLARLLLATGPVPSPVGPPSLQPLLRFMEAHVDGCGEGGGSSAARLRMPPRLVDAWRALVVERVGVLDGAPAGATLSSDVADVARLARLVVGASGPQHGAVALGLAREVGGGPAGIPGVMGSPLPTFGHHLGHSRSSGSSIPIWLVHDCSWAIAGQLGTRSCFTALPPC